MVVVIAQALAGGLAGRDRDPQVKGYAQLPSGPSNLCVAFFRVLGFSGLFGRLLVTRALGLDQGYNFGQVLPKYIFFSDHTPWYYNQQ